ncbi:arrestin domain-containing protein 4 [Culex quinquefasciatus]|uniref:Arrestin domain-containing protein 4 n=1 Tax=Culex quinquefasciatus TaxID=7176 RepID=B0WMD8_CULQU|nr:arrestin domain-containing protein 4 [Culex quinquefasciatus]|eukprot:XP_001849872.1 arrestin domain-containing protein 4 [Culex quinquefasciatus]
MPTTCKFRLRNDTNKLYYCGEKLEGSVDLTFSDAKKVNGIKLIIAGVVHVKWLQYRGPNRYSTTFKGSEACLHSEIDLLRAVGDSTADVPAGKHTYSFDCFLPESLPATFEGKHGRIQYIITVILQRSWKADKIFTIEFIVLRNVDLNTQPPSIRGPARTEITRSFRCWPCRTGPLVVALQTSATGYVPGQRIPVLLEINNGSSSKIQVIHLKLVMVVSYSSDTPRAKIKIDREDVVRAELDQIDDPDEVKYEESLLIPHLPATSCSDCCSKKIRIEYELEAELEVGAVHQIMKLTIPVLIGTVPLNCDRRESTIMELET